MSEEKPNAERILISKMVAASGGDYNDVEDEIQSLVNDPAHKLVLKAMDEYAAQVLSEYKEKLKAEVKKDIDYYQSIKLTEYGEGYLVRLKDIDKLIKGPL